MRTYGELPYFFNKLPTDSMNPFALTAKRTDYERYLCSLFVPFKYRADVWAVMGLAHEVLKIPASVSEEMIGLIKLKWWQENLHHLAKGHAEARRDHPVLMALEPALVSQSIPLAPIDALLESLSSQCAAELSLSAAQDTFAAYYQLLGYASGSPHPETFAPLGKHAALIATIRTRALKHQVIDVLPAPGKLPTDNPASDTSSYYRKLYRLHNLWQKRLATASATQNPDLLHHIPFIALKLL